MNCTIWFSVFGDDDLSNSSEEHERPTQSSLMFDLEKFRNPEVAGTFQVTIGGKFAPLIHLRDDGINNMITIYNIAVTDKPVRYLKKNGVGNSPG